MEGCEAVDQIDKIEGIKVKLKKKDLHHDQINKIDTTRLTQPRRIEVLIEIARHLPILEPERGERDARSLQIPVRHRE